MGQRFKIRDNIYTCIVIELPADIGELLPPLLALYDHDDRCNTVNYCHIFHTRSDTNVARQYILFTRVRSL